VKLWVVVFGAAFWRSIQKIIDSRTDRGPAIRYSFQGVLTVQAYIYYESFPEDLRRLKSLVKLCATDPDRLIIL